MIGRIDQFWQKKPEQKPTFANFLFSFKDDASPIGDLARFAYEHTQINIVAHDGIDGIAGVRVINPVPEDRAFPSFATRKETVMSWVMHVAPKYQNVAIEAMRLYIRMWRVNRSDWFYPKVETTPEKPASNKWSEQELDKMYSHIFKAMEAEK